MTVSYSWKELGATGCKTTNFARQVVAGSSTVAAPGANANHIIYQIDWDSSVQGMQLIVGDNAAADGADRIALNQKGVTQGTRVFPNGFICGANKAIAAVFSSSGAVDGWVRITYTTDIRS